MSTARILNVIALIFFAVSLLIWEPLIIYIAIAFLVASIIFWRIKSK